MFCSCQLQYPIYIHLYGCCWIIELHVQFAQFDKDGDGRITREEFIGVMTMLGYNVDVDEVDCMLRAADTDGK